MKYSHCFPAWGPYGKKYMGISRIADHSFAKGVRFDFCTVPAIFGGDIRVPNVTVPCGCHPWRCSPDYSLITYRFDLVCKDTVYAEVSYVRLDDESILIRTELVNNSQLMQNCLINFFESAEYPDSSYCELTLPEKCAFKNAVDYDSYNYAVKRPWDEQNPDGFKKGEFRDCRFTDCFGLGDRVGKWHMPHRYLPVFGAEKGDSVSFTLNCPCEFDDAVLAIRYRTAGIEYKQGKMVGVRCVPGKTNADFLLNGSLISLPASDELQTVCFPLGKVPQGDYRLALEAVGTGGAEFDFLCIAEKCDADRIVTQTKSYDYTPSITCDDCLSSCRYKDIDGEFILRTFNENTRFRRIETGALEDCMTARLSNADVSFDDVTESFTGSFARKHSDDGFFLNTIVHTLFVEPGASRTEYAVISKGKTDYLTPDEYEKIYLERRAETPDIKFNSRGSKYELSNEILRATLLTNAVYPIYKHGEYIIHHTPGKRWDCLYTWDSGFIGLGMNEWAPEYADYILDTYLSDESNPDYAFLHHGSPVPVHIYQYLEMLKRSNDKASLYALYPRVKLYYLFLAGKVRSSTTAKFKSGLTTTYDYFYSSSGMDDYPAQVAMMEQNLRDTAAPVISSAQVIRCGKILSMVASKLGLDDDVAQYSADIERITRALNEYSWDEQSGYYGYVLHDKDYNPVGIFTTQSGENLNKGLDGIYPLIAGVCNEHQKQAILSHLKNKHEMLSPYGISAVDMSAGYFKVNGYWNGNVWFPHQWFIWKSLLDLGESDFAFTIAELALEAWRQEVDYSYYTFEMVSVVTGRGGWFHNFGGLSTPINMWANAYYKPGTFTTGLDTFVDSAVFSPDCKQLEAKLTYFGNNGEFAVIAAMDEGSACRASLDGKSLAVTERKKGCFEVKLSINDRKVHTLIIG